MNAVDGRNAEHIWFRPESMTHWRFMVGRKAWDIYETIVTIVTMAGGSCTVEISINQLGQQLGMGKRTINAYLWLLDRCGLLRVVWQRGANALRVATPSNDPTIDFANEIADGIFENEHIHESMVQPMVNQLRGYRPLDLSAVVVRSANGVAVSGVSADVQEVADQQPPVDSDGTYYPDTSEENSDWLAGVGVNNRSGKRTKLAAKSRVTMWAIYAYALATKKKSPASYLASQITRNLPFDYSDWIEFSQWLNNATPAQVALLISCADGQSDKLPNGANEIMVDHARTLLEVHGSFELHKPAQPRAKPVVTVSGSPKDEMWKQILSYLNGSLKIRDLPKQAKAFVNERGGRNGFDRSKIAYAKRDWYAYSS